MRAFTLMYYASSGLSDEEFAAKAASELADLDGNCSVFHVGKAREHHGIPSSRRAAALKNEKAKRERKKAAALAAAAKKAKREAESAAAATAAASKTDAQATIRFDGIDDDLLMMLAKKLVSAQQLVALKPTDENKLLLREARAGLLESVSVGRIASLDASIASMNRKLHIIASELGSKAALEEGTV